MKIVFSNTYKEDTEPVKRCILSFDKKGEKFDERDRNSLKLFKVSQDTINIKSFKIPNLINKIAYKTVRTSKAYRSFEYAHKLLDKEIFTPTPIAYAEEKSLLFGRSFYVSEHLDYDLTYRELCYDSQYDGNEDILASFAKFTYSLHEKGIHFLDHSPGNTLIKIRENGYDFYLVDLNRMKFGIMDFPTRMSNFSRLSNRDRDIRIMAKSYAEASSETEKKVYEAMLKGSQDFQRKFHKKKRLKKKLKFWKR